MQYQTSNRNEVSWEDSANAALLEAVRRSPTGLLLRPGAASSSLLSRTGTEPIRQPEFYQLYLDLISPSPDFPGLDQVKEHVSEVRDRGEVPIAILDVNFNTLDAKLNRRLAAFYRSRTNLRVPHYFEDHLETAHVTFACSLLGQVFFMFERQPFIHYGHEVNFYLDPDLYFSNEKGRLASVEVDAGDGQGWRSVAIGGRLQVTYDSAGIKNLSLRITTADGPREASWQQEVADTITFDQSVKLTGKVVNDGDSYSGSGMAYVLYGYTSGVKNSSLKQPLVIADGFQIDSQGDDPVIAMYNHLGQNNANLLRQAGYDLVFVTYAPKYATKKLQHNAAVVVGAILQMYTPTGGFGPTPPDNPSLVGGVSMGGLVVRYGLTWLETNWSTYGLNNIQFPVKTFFSIDSPNQMACIPMGVQFTILQLADYPYKVESAIEYEKKLYSDAARQMLVYVVDSGVYINAGVENDDWEDFYEGLKNINGTGYPKTTFNIGIANGTARKGPYVRPSEESDYNRAMKVDGYYAICYSSFKIYTDPTFDNGSTDIACCVNSPGSFYINDGINGPTVAYSCAQGGLEPFFQKLADQLADPLSSSDKDIDHKSCALIPTFSALDFDVDDDDIFDDLRDCSSPFDALYWEPSKSQNHATLNTGMMWFILGQLGLGADMTWSSNNVVLPDKPSGSSSPQTSAQPAVLEFDNNIYIAYRGETAQNKTRPYQYYMYWSFYNGTSWSTEAKISSDLIYGPPSLAIGPSPDNPPTGNYLWLSTLSPEGISFYTLDLDESGQTWTRGASYSASNVTAVALGSYNNQVVFATVSDDGDIAVQNWQDGTSLNFPAGVESQGAPLLLNHTDKLYVLYVGSDSTIGGYWFDGSTWESVWSDGSDYQLGSECTSVGACSYQERLYVSGFDKDNNLLFGYETADGWTRNLYPVKQQSTNPPALTAYNTGIFLYFSGVSSNNVYQLAGAANKIIWKSLSKYTQDQTSGVPVGFATDDGLFLVYRSQNHNPKTGSTYNLHASILKDGVWQSTITLQDGSGNSLLSINSPTITSVTSSQSEKTFYLAYTDSKGQVQVTSTNSLESGEWPAALPSPGVSATSQPMLFAFGGQLYLGVFNGSTINILTYNGTSWESISQNLPSLSYKSSPFLLDMNGQLALFVNVNNNSAFYSTYDGSSWSKPITAVEADVDGAPAVVFYKNAVIMVYASDNAVEFCYGEVSSSGINWTPLQIQIAQGSSTSPWLCEYNDALVLLYQNNQSINYEFGS